MNTEIFFNTILEFDKGYNGFNLGYSWSFQFNQKWYPTHAFMKRYRLNTGETSEMPLHRAVFELSKLIPIVSAEVEFKNHFPIEINK
jgi:hypothetical protein